VPNIDTSQADYLDEEIKPVLSTMDRENRWSVLIQGSSIMLSSPWLLIDGNGST